MSRNLLIGGLIRQGGRLSPPNGRLPSVLSSASAQATLLSSRFAGILATCSAQSVVVRPAQRGVVLARADSPPGLLMFTRRGFATYPEHIKVPLPALSPTMETGSIVQWVKKEGDELSEGDLLCEIETDKAMMGFETPEEGFLAKILLQEGEKDVPIGKLLCIIVPTQDDVAAFKDFTPTDADDAAKPGPPPLPREKESAPPQPITLTTKPKPPPPTPPKPSPAAIAKPGPTGGRVPATPYARKLAADSGVDLSTLSGSGPGGRILAADVETAAASPRQGAVAAFSPAPSGGFTDLPLSSMRKTIAKRLTESKATIPHYYLTVEVEMDAVMGVREKLNRLVADDGYKISVNDFIVKASALACQRVPAANSYWMGDFIRENHFVDVSVAVSTEAGLITPIIRNAGAKGLAHICRETRELAAKARDGKLQPDEFIGGTFTVSNLGMFGVRSFSAIVNPPQSAILAVGATSAVLLPGPDGGSREARVMAVTLSCDHRVVDGAVGAQWLQHFKRSLEKPHTMLL